jgi:glyoxylase-like metal-dependent hydrolase (beta-lactamase superfamily II)
VRSQVLSDEIVVFTSAVWDTTCTAVRSGEQTLLIDSPVFPEELSAMPRLLGDHGFPVEGLRLFNTHGDWDHILGPLMFPQAPLWCGLSTAQRLADNPDELAAMKTTFDEMFYVKRPQPLSLDRLEPLPVPGQVQIGELSIELIRADGHTIDGTAALFREERALAAGDYVSPVELPRLRGPLGAHLETLDRLEPVIAGAEVVIPGHGHPMTREEALKILTEDRQYLEQLRDRGPDASLPAGRDDAEQRRIHVEMNVPSAAGRPVEGIAGGNLPG